jgi:anti-anti-sigma factor
MPNAEWISGQLRVAVAAGPKVVVADMTATTFCDSMGVRVLVLAHRHAAARGTELRLLMPCPRVLRVMEVLGVDAVLPIYHSREQVLAGPAQPRQKAGTWPDRPGRAAGRRWSAGPVIR